MTEATPLIYRQVMAVAAASETEAMQPDDTPAIGGSSEPGACDYQACSSFYHSFRASDCTYQPFGSGARELCEK